MALLSFSQHLPSRRHHSAGADAHGLQTAHLDHLGVKALAHLCAPMAHQHRAICVHMDQGSRLREENDTKQKIQQILTQFKAWDQKYWSPGKRKPAVEIWIETSDRKIKAV